jgi:DUF4097 and DUF4098 domain-containing protein YvlB
MLAAVLSASASIRGTFQKAYQVNGPANLEVLTKSGDINVHAGPAGSITIQGKIHVGDRWFGNRQSDVEQLEKNPPISQSGNSIRIDYVTVRDISIDYDITVPADTTLRTQSGSGDQWVDGLLKGASLESGSGDIRLNDVTGDIDAQTGSGNVEARGIHGPFAAQAGSGDIRLEEQGEGNVRVHTGSGNVEARGIHGLLQLESGSGDVIVEGTQTGAWDIQTGSGDVDLRVPQNANFELRASTNSGSVVVEHAVKMTVQGNVDRERHSVNGKVGAGGPVMTVHTGSGDIHIS